MHIEPIGVIRTPFRQAAGTPLQPSMAQGAEGTVEVFAEYAAGLKDLEEFERIWLIYWFHRAAPAELVVQPYMDSELRGVFATRAPSRPNPIGMSAVKLLSVEGALLRVAEIDILDGTPLVDIKPYAPLFDHYPVRRCGWLDRRSRRDALADDRFQEP
ncbi:MAG: tRNA (N6-threonylcarbamoyladenosine(37)-N6)-methyltransferase TrmO [Bryobacteraceae bacterium]|nr:tRNA (N6-threonylcarbamoyladenosine(37)-N6)-methyltransferase TrmO [Bryobacteraceae bacterium]